MLAAKLKDSKPVEINWKTSLQLIIKHAVDRLVSVILGVALLPLFILVAVLIKLEDGGAIIFFQDRLGRNGEVFTIWKFRTMHENADSILDSEGRPKANRVTRVGRILRRFSLDELGQIVNVFLGDMSFIGPRAALLEHLSRYTGRQTGRLAVKPGITGLAQVMGRNTLKWSERIEYDIQYIRDYSLLLDVVIALKTIKVVVFGEGMVMDRNPEQVDDLSNSGIPNASRNENK